jgi:hypothetical protein
MEIFGDIQSHLTNAANNMPHFTGLNVTAILNSVYAFAGIIAVGFIVYGAINYVNAQGDPGKIRSGGQTIAFALIGLVVVILAAAITNFVAGSV